jgi:hypothetical protein
MGGAGGQMQDVQAEIRGARRTIRLPSLDFNACTFRRLQPDEA